MAVLLTWTDLNSGVRDEDGIRIYRDTSAIDLEDLPAPLASLASGAITYTDSTVLPGLEYYYVVEAYKGSLSAFATISLTMSGTILLTVAALSVEDLPGGTLIVPNGTGGDTDTTIRELGNILDEGVAGAQRYKIVYSGHSGAYTGTNVYVHYAYSADGVTWTKGGRVIGTTRALEDPHLVKHGGTYYLFAEDKADTPFRNIRLFTSTDFSAWTDRGDVLDIGTGWEATDVSSPVVWVEGSTFYMLYEGRGVGQNGAIGLATAAVSVTPTFTKNGGNPVLKGSNLSGVITWANQIVCDDLIIADDGTYVLLYHGRPSDTGTWKSGIATSANLTTWTPLPDASSYVANGRNDIETVFAPIDGVAQFAFASDLGDGIRLTPEGDPATLVVNFTGSNGSTTFTDESDWANALTANGNVQIQSNAAVFDGTGDYISSPARDIWQLHDFDWTLEFFKVKFDVNTTLQCLASQFAASGTWSWRMDYRGDLSPDRLRMLGYVTTTGTSFLIDATWTPTVGVEYDICFERKGTTVRIYVDGVMIGSGTTSSVFAKATVPMWIGGDGFGGGADWFDGTMKAVRFAKGRARYANNSGYTVPTLPI